MSAVATSIIVQVSQRTVNQLQQRASSLGISSSKLVTVLLEVISKDNLFNAILDSDEFSANDTPLGR